MQQYLFTLVLFIISLVFCHISFKDSVSYTGAKYEITTSSLGDQKRDLDIIKESIGELTNNYRNTEAKIREANSKLYEKEIEVAEKIIEDGGFNSPQCSFNDVVDNYYIQQIIFHCSFSDSDSGYLTVNIKSNTIVKTKNK